MKNGQIETPASHGAFHERALPLDNPKRHPQIEITPFLSAVIGLASFRGEFQVGRTQVDELEDFVPIEGTAFFYAYPERGSDGTDRAQMRVWLVTAKHVIQEIFRDPKRIIAVRMNFEDSSRIAILYLDVDDEWHQHETLDVAVLSTNTNSLTKRGLSIKCMNASEWAFNRAGAKKFGLTESDPIFMIGFPHGWREGLRDYPIVRQGIIAQLRGWLNGDHDTFLIDGSAFPGMSGGPVLSKAVEQEDGRFGGRFRLIGLISEIAKSDLEYELGSEVRPAASESADLIAVIPTDAIHETIEAAMEADTTSSD